MQRKSFTLEWTGGGWDREKVESAAIYCCSFCRGAVCVRMPVSRVAELKGFLCEILHKFCRNRDDIGGSSCVCINGNVG